MLGETLLGKRKYAEAEPLLIAGFEGIRERQESIRDPKRVLTETIQSFIQLFEATGRSEQADEWRAKLAVVQTAGLKGRPAWPPFSSDNQAAANR